METVAVVCEHRRVREIGEDFDKEGTRIRLVRCQQCGLLMREYLSKTAEEAWQVHLVEVWQQYPTNSPVSRQHFAC